VNWLAILLALAALGGNAAPGAQKAKPRCAAHAKHCKKAPAKKHRSKPKAPAAPVVQPAPPVSAGPAPPAEPTATATPGGTPAPTATPNPYPSRTGVDLTEWRVRSSYRTLAAGPIEFNVTDLGEDDHNLSVRGGGTEYGGIDLHPDEVDTLTLTLAPGTYTLYCNLPTHEDLGMSTVITVR
jgi:hypothetical protein